MSETEVSQRIPSLVKKERDPVTVSHRLWLRVDYMSSTKWKPPQLHLLYFEMVDRWRNIVGQQISRSEKQEACLARLVEVVDRLAAARVGQINAPLRFYADMLELKQYLRPHSHHDELGNIAISPSFNLVSDWLLDNNHSDRTKSAGGPINITRYMAWQQLRATMIGEQLGFAALDISSVHNEYVFAVLQRLKPIL